MCALRKPVSAPARCLLPFTLPSFQYGHGITTVWVFMAPFWGRAEDVGADLFPSRQTAGQSCPLYGGRAAGWGSIHWQRGNTKIRNFPTGKEMGVNTSTGTCFLLCILKHRSLSSLYLPNIPSPSPRASREAARGPRGCHGEWEARSCPGLAAADPSAGTG